MARIFDIELEAMFQFVFADRALVFTHGTIIRRVAARLIEAHTEAAIEAKDRLAHFAGSWIDSHVQMMLILVLTIVSIAFLWRSFFVAG